MSSSMRDQAVDFLTSSSQGSVLARTVAIAAVAGGITYYATRQHPPPPSDKPPVPPPKDDDTTSKLRSTHRPTLPSDDDAGKRVRFEYPEKDEVSKPVPVAVFWDVDVSQSGVEIELDGGAYHRPAYTELLPTHGLLWA